MTNIDYAALFLLIGIFVLSLTALWQMYVVLTEIYSLDRYKDNKKLIWIAIAIFFSFSLAIYYFCPNARKKGLLFFIMGLIGLISYGLGMWFKHQAML